jgi:hypothetical protein
MIAVGHQARANQLVSAVLTVLSDGWLTRRR